MANISGNNADNVINGTADDDRVDSDAKRNAIKQT